MKKAIVLILLFAFGIAGAPALYSQDRPAPNPPAGPLQRSEEIIGFKRMAEGGPQRGQEIYFYKCWVCHNAYTREAGSPAPTLKDLVKRPIMLSGKPMTDENIADKIREGGPGMPGYKYGLTDKDINDLVSFFRAGMCCWEDKEEHNPPLNPRFRAPRTPPRGE